MMGTRKLYFLVQSRIKLKGIKIGRDKLFSLLREEGLLVRRKRRYAVTTQSRHRFHKYVNLVKSWKPSRPHQLLVSDITYLRLHQGFCYLALVTDAFSRKIVGWDLSHSLGLTGSLNAARMAIKLCPNPKGMIHHSDRGIQYCANEYISLLTKNEICPSMGEAGNCYENALAERMNGILKQEYALNTMFKNIESAHKAVTEAINLYNNERPHLALNYKTPTMAHNAA